MDATGPTTPPRQATLDKPSQQGTSSPIETTPPSNWSLSPTMTMPLPAATTTNDKHSASSPASPGRGKMRENADGSRTPVATSDNSATTAQSDHTTEPQELSESDRDMLEQSLRETRRKIKVESQKIHGLVAQLNELILTVREKGRVRSNRARGRRGPLHTTISR